MATRKPKADLPVPSRKQLPMQSGAPLGRGFEEADAESFAIPFLAVLQKGTPWADPDAAEYIKGAKPGMLINTVTLDLYEEAEIIPCAFQRRFNRWAPRDSGGGFKGMFMPSMIAPMEASGTIKQNDEGRWFFTMPDGSINEKKCDILTDTRMHFCQMIGEDGSLSPVLISLSRTQLKKSKQWMSLMQTRGGDMFGTVFTVKTRDEENDKGKWKGWVIQAARQATAQEQAVGAAFYQSVVAGSVKVKMDQHAGE